MIRHPEIVERALQEYDRQHPLTLEQKCALLNSLQEEAVLLGHFKQEQVTEGLEEEIKVIVRLHSYAH